MHDKTPLMIAAQQKKVQKPEHIEIMQLLLESKAHIDTVNSKNKTALMIAARYDRDFFTRTNTDAIELLCLAGAHLDQNHHQDIESRERETITQAQQTRQTITTELDTLKALVFNDMLLDQHETLLTPAIRTLIATYLLPANDTDNKNVNWLVNRLIGKKRQLRFIQNIAAVSDIEQIEALFEEFTKQNNAFAAESTDLLYNHDTTDDEGATEKEDNAAAIRYAFAPASAHTGLSIGSHLTTNERLEIRID